MTPQNLPLLDPDLLRCIRQFPFPLGGPRVSDTLARLRLYLPDSQEGHELVRVFFAQFGMLFHGVSQAHVRDVLLPIAYAHNSHLSDSTANADAHKLGQIFVIFAIASLVRVPVAERLAVTTHYAQLSLAALGAVPIFEQPSLETVQAVYLCALFEFMLQNGTEETGRAYMSFACQLCYIVSPFSFPHTMTHLDKDYSLVYVRIYTPELTHTRSNDNSCIDRDPGQWGLSQDEKEQRRSTWWMVFRGDLWEVR
jgi:hypothetical protein